MTSPSEKHMAAAADLAERIDFAYRSRRHELHFASVSSLLAAALANAEREGMKRAAEIAKTAGHWEAANVGGSPWQTAGAVWRGLDANQIADKILSETGEA